MGQTTPVLGDFPSGEDLPDLFGRACTELAQGCYNSIAVGDEDTFVELFSHYFGTSITAFHRISEKLSDRDDWFRMPFIIDPIIDVMEISGYAIAFTELEIGSYWDIVKIVWDRYLSDENKLPRIEALLKTAEYKDGSFITSTPRDLMRTSWRQTFGQRMSSLSIEDDLDIRHLGGVPTIENQPPFIQALIKSTLFSIPDNLYTAFLAVYFDDKSLIPELRLPKQVMEFQERLKQYKKKHLHEDNDHE